MRARAHRARAILSLRYYLIRHLSTVNALFVLYNRICRWRDRMLNAYTTLIEQPRFICTLV